MHIWIQPATAGVPVYIRVVEDTKLGDNVPYDKDRRGISMFYVGNTYGRYSEVVIVFVVGGGRDFGNQKKVDAVRAAEKSLEYTWIMVFLLQFSSRRINAATYI